MEVVAARCAGLDVHKRTVVACVRIAEGNRRVERETRRFATFAGDLEELRDWLVGQGVTVVLMESTGVFWKPVWRVLEGHVELLLGNARHIKTVPGRKTDVKDAEWLADLAAHGLVRGSFVPPAEIRALRDLTRYRRRVTEHRAQQIQRIDKMLEDTGIKLGSVASNTMGVSGRAMLDALLAGERDPAVLANLAKSHLRLKIPELNRALVGDFKPHHEVLLTELLTHYDDLGKVIARLNEEISRAIEPYALHRDRLCTIPGVARINAEVIIAEIGVDMAVFPTAGHLASWAGLCPGNNESAGKHHSGRVRPGNVWLRAALVQSAWGAARSRGTYLAAQYWNITRRRGKSRALVAVAHSILEIAYHVINENADYHELGGDYFVKRADPQRETRRLVARLEALGHHVELATATN